MTRKNPKHCSERDNCVECKTYVEQRLSLLSTHTCVRVAQDEADGREEVALA